MRRPDQQFDLEHSIVEQGARRLDVLELPLSRKVFILFGIGALIIGGIALAGFLNLAALKSDFYKARAAMNVEQTIMIPAVRGIIYDRFGNVLADNEATHRIVLNTGLVKRENIDIDTTLLLLDEILDVDLSELYKLVEKSDFEKSALVTLARDISDGQIEKINALNNKALEIHDDYRRNYLRGPAFSHVLGYTGLAKFRDLKGKVGLEEYYEDFLAGTDGVRIIYRDAKSDILEEKLLSIPKNGNDLHITLDSDLQEYFYNRLRQTLWSLGRDTAIGIAINPQNGEILSLISLPSYDNNIFTKSDNIPKRSSILNDKALPLFNRAVSGVYSPGSTIKPLVAVAALSEGVIDPKKEIYSAGFIEIPNPYFPDQPSRFLDWKAHGWVDLRSALARSSNVYFYSVGGGFEDVDGLGVEKLKKYWEYFGLGKKTGIDLNFESVGFLPDPEEKMERKNDIWRLGDTYNVSIGQGDLLVTPIQLTNYIATIANGGKLYKLHFISGIRNQESGIMDFKGRQFRVLGDISYLGDAIREVQEGMKDAVTKWYGTAYLLADLPVSAAAKTGSAQTSNNTKTNAFFVGYIPYENPQIAILVLIENAREGSLNAVPVGRDVLEWYYWNRLVNNE